MTRKRKHDSAKEIVQILRRHLVEKVPVATLCQKLNLADGGACPVKKRDWDLYKDAGSACRAMVARGLGTPGDPRLRRTRPPQRLQDTHIWWLSQCFRFLVMGILLG